MIPGMLPLAVRRGTMPPMGARRQRSAHREHTSISPGSGLTGPRRQHRHRCVVDVQCVRRYHRVGQCIDERLQGRRGRPNPAGKGRGFQADTFAGEDLGLAIEGEMVVVLGNDDMGQQPGAGRAAGNRVIGDRRRDNRIANPARQFLADVPNHFEAAGYVIEGLGDVFRRSGAAPLHKFGQLHGAECQRLFAREVVWQWPTGRLLRFGRVLDRGGDNPRGGGEPLGPVFFQALDLPARAARPRAPASPRSGRTRPADSAPAGTSTGDFRLGGQRVLRHRGDNPLQRFRLIRQLIRGNRHHRVESDPVILLRDKILPQSLCRTQPGSSGFQIRCGMRQSMRSSSMPSCSA